VADPDSLWRRTTRWWRFSCQATDPDGDEVTIMITNITSNQPDDARGSGNTSPDWEFDGDDTATLRAERSGKSGERVYTIEYTADDGQGGICEGSVEVRVPRSKGKGK
jgi:hypothetical protein